MVALIDGARRKLPFPAALHAWDYARAVRAEALCGVDVVINLAGEPVAEGRWSADSRVQGSASGYYGGRGDERLTADSGRGQGLLADVVEQWEAELQPLLQRRPDLRVPAVRTGVVLAREGGSLVTVLPMFRLSAAGQLGSGRQWMGRTHLDDIVGLFMHALDAADTGLLEASPIIGGHDE